MNMDHAAHSTQAQTAPSQVTAPSSASAQDAALFEQLYSVTDKDGSQTINTQELGDFVEYARQQVSPSSAPLSSNGLDALFQKLDSNGDGSLGRQEFTTFLNDAMSEGRAMGSQSPALAPLNNQTGTMVDPSDTAADMQQNIPITEGPACMEKPPSGCGANDTSAQLIAEFEQADVDGNGLNQTEFNNFILNTAESPIIG